MLGMLCYNCAVGPEPQKIQASLALPEMFVALAAMSRLSLFGTQLSAASLSCSSVGLVRAARFLIRGRFCGEPWWCFTAIEICDRLRSLHTRGLADCCL